MNTNTDITPSDELATLIAKARSIDAQIEASVDDEEIRDLVDDLLQTNNAIINHPVASLADVQAKAQHLLHAIEEIGDPLDGASLVPLLRSFAGRA